MTPILFWNIKWLFVRFTFCHRTAVTLDTQWQNARMFLERINSRYTTEHDGKIMNQIFKTTVQCVHRSFDLLPSVCHATDQWTCWWSVGQDSPSRCALCPRDRPGWKLECDTRSAAELPRQHSRPDLSQGCWMAVQRLFDEIRHGTLQELDSWIRSMRRRASCWNTKWLSDFCSLLTNLWEKTSLQQSFAVVTCICLGSFVVLLIKLTDVLPALDTATDAITLSLKCLRPLIRRWLATDDFP